MISLFSTSDWLLLAAILSASILAVFFTNTPHAPRLMRILSRNLLVIGVLLLVYQLGLLALTSRVSPRSNMSAPAPAVGDSVVGGPSLSASFINHVLAVAGSPATGTGQSLYDLSVQYHIDDAYALATFEHESTYGKYGYAVADHSLGNIICAGYPTCNGRFRWYATWAEGFEDFYRLIAREYVAQGLTTIDRIIVRYAPSSENDTAEYIQTIRRAISAFRAGHVV